MPPPFVPARVTTERVKMLRGELYDPQDPGLVAARERARELTGQYNRTGPGEDAERRAILTDLFGSVGDEVTFDTSGTTGEIERYEWTVDGDPVESTDGSTLNHTFEETGTAEVEVTVTTASNRTDAASQTVEVVEGEESASGVQTPGFGIVVAVVALVGATLLVARRTQG